MKDHARSIRGLSNIKFSFDGDTVSDLTNTHFDEYSEGSDLVILGRLNQNDVPYLTINLEYTDVEGTVWNEQKSIAVRYINNTSERDIKFGAGQDSYNPIKQQWAVTAVHQLLKKRAVATTEAEYNILTSEAKKLSYDHHIVSPVVSFLIRKPKSSLNLINNKLEAPGTDRERRSDGKAQETHEIRFVKYEHTNVPSALSGLLVHFPPRNTSKPFRIRFRKKNVQKLNNLLCLDINTENSGGVHQRGII